MLANARIASALILLCMLTPACSKESALKDQLENKYAKVFNMCKKMAAGGPHRCKKVSSMAVRMELADSGLEKAKQDQILKDWIAKHNFQDIYLAEGAKQTKPIATRRAPKPAKRAASAPARNAKASKYSNAAIAYTLGNKISMGALGHAAGLDMGRRMRQCATLARWLGTSVPPLFAVRKNKRTSNNAAALNYLLNTAGKPLGKHIRVKHGKKAASLFEAALKVNLLNVLYASRTGLKDRTTKALVKAIVSRYDRAGMGGVTKDLVAKIKRKAKFRDVQAAISRLHKTVDAKLRS